MDDKAALKADFEQLQREYKNMEAMRKVCELCMCGMCVPWAYAYVCVAGTMTTRPMCMLWWSD